MKNYKCSLCDGKYNEEDTTFAWERNKTKLYFRGDTTETQVVCQNCADENIKCFYCGCIFINKSLKHGHPNSEALYCQKCLKEADMRIWDR
jgi:hypothetical protein